MSKLIASAAIRASHEILEKVDSLLTEVTAEKGEDFQFEFMDTGYFLPQIYAMTGFAVKTLKDMRTALEAYARPLLKPVPEEKVYKPYLGEALDAGMATLFAQEILMALRYIKGLEPVTDPEMNLTYNGFITDSILRDLGFQLVDGSMPGYVVILGAAESDERAEQIVRDLQQKNILIFLAGHVKGNSVTKQLHRRGVEMGWPTRIVPLGPDTEHTIYALDWAARAGLTFGGLKAGDYALNLKYSLNRVFAFAMVLGDLDDMKWATGAGAINQGFPAVCDTDVPEIRPRGVCTYEHVVRELDQDKIVQTAIETRGLKIIVEKPPIPVAYGPAFEGERIRKEDTFLEFGGNQSPSFELVRMLNLDEVEDGKVELIGTENVEKYEAGGVVPLGVVIEVAGRKMQKDFEPVLERKTHDFVNMAQGVWHMGQRDICWSRISKSAFSEGFRIHHFGEIHVAMMKSKFPAIVDKVQVKIYTDEKDVVRLRDEARKVYHERDIRVANMTDESVDTYYSCLLCQSFAPNHVCVVSPERLGLCGAVNWMDAKAAFEINPTGWNQPVKKGETLDAVKGRWTGVEEYVKKESHGALDGFSAYSLMDAPMTSCGCFEAIVSVVPEANGIMIVDRGYPGMTPIGMKFSTLAGTVGGGTQTPGFTGIGKYFITSRKFLTADGGFKRIVWLTTSIKNQLGEALKKRAEEIGEPDLLNKIADETVAVDAEQLVAFLTEKGHPALTMESMF
ncbi:MAG: CO dehydrogenase/CO-methylating acetyl-CoA synthase complex subunit beta [Nitrospirae bacterium CG17_big_fil_post_rev_8_21_14_2_50_50_9]|nr:MAG: CO dehydrogenase/CO-methylating acetyl-CoA synthase complex subunit beta [Nitrospirae bacterium CG17_big_fil_post_rev_8_21_14_2_50_50_9]